jgi:imidazolonepropionase-like amidohydrolase
MAIGTDALGDVPGLVNSPFGLTVHCELQNFVDAGLGAAEALRAATAVPARLHRLTDRGTVASGLRADLVLLNANPLANISNVRDIARVWVGGLEYEGVVGIADGQTCQQLLV